MMRATWGVDKLMSYITQAQGCNVVRWGQLQGRHWTCTKEEATTCNNQKGTVKVHQACTNLSSIHSLLVCYLSVSVTTSPRITLGAQAIAWGPEAPNRQKHYWHAVSQMHVHPMFL